MSDTVEIYEEYFVRQDEDGEWEAAIRQTVTRGGVETVVYEGPITIPLDPDAARWADLDALYDEEPLTADSE